MDVIQSTDQSAETHTAWQRYMSTHEGSDYQEYAKARNQARNETSNEIRKALPHDEKDIAKSNKTNPHLKRNDGSKTETDEDKVNQLNT